MEILIIILQITFYFTFPLFAHYCSKYKWLSWLGAVGLCYLGGMLAGNLYTIDSKVAKLVAGVIPIAIALLLFNTDFITWIGHARETIIAFFLALISVLVVSIPAGILFFSYNSEAKETAGMLVGVYTGGTPNLASIGKALEVSESTYAFVNTADILVSGVYLIILLSIAKSILQRFLPAYTSIKSHSRVKQEKDKLLPLNFIYGLVIAIIIVALSIGLSLLLLAKISFTIIIVTTTTLAIGASFSTEIRSMREHYLLGDYLVLVFCVAIGSLTQLDKILTHGSIILYHCIFVVIGSILCHYILCKFLRIDVDTAIITSTACIFGPAFIAPVARAIDNEEIILSGLTTALIGLAVGNYLGLGVFYLLGYLLP